MFFTALLREYSTLWLERANAGHSYVGSRVHRCSWRLPECLDNTARVRAKTKTAAEGRPLK